jgi:hypothetical protein
MILQLCIAALAVACRTFLSMLIHTQHIKPVDCSLDLWAKWNAAEKLLSPAVDALPPLLIFPVVLFVAGLGDLLLSNGLQMSPPPKVILVTSGIGLFAIAGILVFLSVTLVHACVHPETSPFSSLVSIFVNKWLVGTFKGCFYHVSSWLTKSSPFAHLPKIDNAKHQHGTLCVTYHEIAPTISDDDTLDSASAALYEVIISQLSAPNFQVTHLISSEQCKTIQYFLSPEASLRSNLTAAATIIRMRSKLWTLGLGIQGWLYF